MMQEHPERHLAEASRDNCVTAAKVLTKHFNVVNEVVALDYYHKWTPLHHAACEGHLEVVALLVSLPEVELNVGDQSLCTALILAARHGHLDVVEHLVSLPGVDVNAADNDAFGALHCAIVTNQLHVVQFLATLPKIELGALRAHHGHTGLHALLVAGRQGRRDIVKFLLSLPSIDIHITDHVGRNVLHHAARFGSVDTLKLLVSMPEVDVNSRSNDGWTALHFVAASRFQHTDAVRFLVSLDGIDIDARTHDGRTASDMAVKEQHRDIVACLAAAASATDASAA